MKINKSDFSRFAISILALFLSAVLWADIGSLNYDQIVEKCQLGFDSEKKSEDVYVGEFYAVRVWNWKGQVYHMADMRKSGGREKVYIIIPKEYEKTFKEYSMQHKKFKATYVLVDFYRNKFPVLEMKDFLNGVSEE